MNIRSGLFQWGKGIFLALFVFSATGLIMVDFVQPDKRSMKNNSGNFGFETGSDFETVNPAGESLALADGDTIVVSSTGADLSYDVTEIRAKAGSTLTIRYENRSDMPHNIVLLNERADINPVGVAALQARDTDYIPREESLQERIIAYTVLAKPGDTVFLDITVPPPGTYPYICTYPGHFTMMQGDLISEE